MLNNHNGGGAARIEWLVLADSAQVVGNKLYLLGGGWDSIAAPNGFPIQHQMASALSVLVPWQETTQKRAFEVEILNEQGVSQVKVNGELEVPGNPGVMPGEIRRSQIALAISLKLEKQGKYAVTARIDGGEPVHSSFNVSLGFNMAQRPR